MLFDPQQFLEAQVTEANDTKSIPVPEGDFVAIIKEAKARQWTSKSDSSKSGLALDVVWSIDSPEVKTLLGRDEVTVKQGIMLDLTEHGTLDMGKGRNIYLGRLREAVGLNTPGQAFSIMHLPGRAALVSIKHRVDGDDIFADVKAVAKV